MSFLIPEPEINLYITGGPEDVFLNRTPQRARFSISQEEQPTLHIHRLIAAVLLDQDKRPEARAAFDGVLDGLRARGLQDGHRFVREALKLDTRLAPA